MAKKSKYPGRTRFDQAMNCIGALIFEHGLRGDLDLAVSTRRIEGATTITVLSLDSVMQFTFSDDERDAKRTAMSRVTSWKPEDPS